MWGGRSKRAEDGIVGPAPESYDHTRPDESDLLQQKDLRCLIERRFRPLGALTLVQRSGTLLSPLDAAIPLGLRIGRSGGHFATLSVDEEAMIGRGRSEEDLARLLIDAFSVDIEVYATKVLVGLRNTGSGDRLAAWARDNPGAFKGLLRTLAVAIGQAGQRQQQSVLLEVALRILRRAPSDIRLLWLEAEPQPYGTPPVNKTVADDFHARLEDALRSLDQDSVGRIARLNRARQREYLDAPVAMRRHLLDKWSAPSQLSETRTQINRLFDSRYESPQQYADLMKRESRERDALRARKRIERDERGRTLFGRLRNFARTVTRADSSEVDREMRRRRDLDLISRSS